MINCQFVDNLCDVTLCRYVKLEIAMGDFSLKEAHDFWHAYHDSTIHRIVSLMENVETWTFDGVEEVEKVLAELGNLFQDIGRVELQQEANFVEMLSCIKMTRMLYIMQQVDLASPGGASKILMHAEKNSLSEEDPNGLFLRRNVVFERLRLLTRLFSPERLSLISKALEEIDVG